MASQVAMGNMSPPARGRRGHGGERRSVSSWRRQGHEEHVPPPLQGGGWGEGRGPLAGEGQLPDAMMNDGGSEGGPRAGAWPGDSATEREDGGLSVQAGRSGKEAELAVGPYCSVAEGPARLREIEPLNECRPG